MNEPSEFENNPKDHIKRLKIRKRQITKLYELFEPYAKEERGPKSLEFLEEIEKQLQEYKEQYPEYFI
jgi:hypothetical protein